MLTLAIFYPQGFEAGWMAAAFASVAVMVALNRWRVYAGWPYLVVTVALWLSLHSAGVSAALAGVLLAVFLPTRPAPAAGPLLAQAATALAALDHAQGEGDGGSIEIEPVWEWASRNLSAASARLLSPADRVERAIEPWSAYVILPLFAFSATGIALNVDMASRGARHVLLGVVLGLVIGKPLGVALAAFVAVKARIAVLPQDSRLRAFIGAALLCGVSDPVALLMADKAFPHNDLAAVAKIGVLAGSLVAAVLGVAVLATGPGEPQASRT
jgi:NhaA family Na+:H+ antiporter